MATTTDDPRKRAVESSIVYGIWHLGNLIYVGVTTTPLSRRLDSHRNAARRGAGNPVHTYIREEVEAPRSDLTIEELPHPTEEAALEELGADVLNVQAADGARYEGHDWDSAELDILEEAESLCEAHRRLDVSWTQVRNASLKLGLVERQRFQTWTDEEVDLLGTDTDEAIANRIGRTRATVQYKRDQLGIEPVTNPDRAFSRTQAFAIRAAYALLTDVTHSGLADYFDVSTSVIGRMLRSEHYQDVPQPSLPVLALSTAAILTAVGSEE